MKVVAIAVSFHDLLMRHGAYFRRAYVCYKTAVNLNSKYGKEQQQDRSR